MTSASFLMQPSCPLIRLRSPSSNPASCACPERNHVCARDRGRRLRGRAVQKIERLPGEDALAYVLVGQVDGRLDGAVVHSNTVELLQPPRGISQDLDGRLSARFTHVYSLEEALAPRQRAQHLPVERWSGTAQEVEPRLVTTHLQQVGSIEGPGPGPHGGHSHEACYPVEKQDDVLAGRRLSESGKDYFLEIAGLADAGQDSVERKLDDAPADKPARDPALRYIPGQRENERPFAYPVGPHQDRGVALPPLQYLLDLS